MYAAYDGEGSSPRPHPMPSILHPMPSIPLPQETFSFKWGQQSRAVSSCALLLGPAAAESLKGDDESQTLPGLRSP